MCRAQDRSPTGRRRAFPQLLLLNPGHLCSTRRAASVVHTLQNTGWNCYMSAAKHTCTNITHTWQCRSAHLSCCLEFVVRVSTRLALIKPEVDLCCQLQRAGGLLLRQLTQQLEGLQQQGGQHIIGTRAADIRHHQRRRGVRRAVRMQYSFWSGSFVLRPQ